jgi:four helix bundle protein
MKQESNKKYGHTKMIIYQNIDEIDMMVQREILPKTPRYNYKLRRQIDDASDSVGSNFVEGYYSGSIPEYLRFLRYSKRSVGELQERVRRCLRKKYIMADLYSRFEELVNKTMYLFNRLMTKLEEKL